MPAVMVISDQHGAPLTNALSYVRDPQRGISDGYDSQQTKASQSMSQKTNTCARNSKNRRGATAVEFAFVAPIFFLLVLGMIDLGRMIMIQHAATNAAREGCRKAVLATTVNSADIENIVRRSLQTTTTYAWNKDVVRVSVPAGVSSSTVSGTELTVGVEIDFADLTWLPFARVGKNLTLGAESTQKRE
jgi:Flp pilus assembly protein TadG